jgi:hypothetical protein
MPFFSIMVYSSNRLRRWVMYQINTLAGVSLLSWCLLAGTVLASAESQKTDGSEGITVEDLGRGLKSAAQNVEKEIPKIGPAIGETFKKVTGKESKKQAAQSPSKEKK